jgi:hypothetical protein
MENDSLFGDLICQFHFPSDMYYIKPQRDKGQSGKDEFLIELFHVERLSRTQ